MQKTRKRRTFKTPLTESQKIYIRSNHRRMSPAEMAKNQNADYNQVWYFMNANKLETSSNVQQRSRTVIINKPVLEGCFDVDARENWAI